MTVLSIISDVCDRVGLTRPSVVVTSTDQQVRQLFSLLNKAGLKLAQEGDWQALTAEWLFLTTATAVQTNTPIPPDLDRFIDDSFFNRTQMRKIIGPITPQEWQQIQTFPAYNRIYLAFRERGGEVLITPTPPASVEIAYEYVSKNWAQSSAGQGKPAFTSDDDGTYLDEELLKLGLQWMWKHAKGLSYAEDFEDYQRDVAKSLGRDGGARALNITGRDPNANFLGVNIPDGGFGL